MNIGVPTSNPTHESLQTKIAQPWTSSHRQVRDCIVAAVWAWGLGGGGGGGVGLTGSRV